MSIDHAMPEAFEVRFRRLREEMGLTKTALAASRYTVSYLSQIESGKRRPSPDALAFLAGRLRVEPQFLATGVPAGLRDRSAYELEEAHFLARTGRATDALGRAQTVIDDARRYGVEDLEAQALHMAADALLILGRPREAVDRYEEALECDRLSERGRGLATASLARAYRQLGDLGYAAELIESYLRANRSTPLDPVVSADLQTVLVSIYFERGDTYRAERAAAGALAAAESGDSASVRANVFWDASRVLAEAKKWKEALDLASRARVIMEDLGDQRRLGLVHNACAFLCLEADPPRTDDATRHLDAAERLFSAVGSPGDLTTVYAERARLALLDGRPQDALACSDRALADAGEDRLERARVLFLRGRALATLTRSREAVSCFEEAASVFQKTGARQQEANCWREIGELQLDAGEVDAAVESLRSGLEALDPRRSRA